KRYSRPTSDRVYFMLRNLVPRIPLADGRGSETPVEPPPSGSGYLVLLFLPILLLLAGCASTSLRTGLSEKDAQEIVVLLHDNGITAHAEKETGEKKDTPTWQVKVMGGSDRLTAAWRILAENGLPREQARGLQEVFASSGMIPTASEEKARLLVGLSGE